jgi:tetratricopeptide (TPR) repeat protein
LSLIKVFVFAHLGQGLKLLNLPSDQKLEMDRHNVWEKLKSQQKLWAAIAKIIGTCLVITAFIYAGPYLGKKTKAYWQGIDKKNGETAVGQVVAAVKSVQEKVDVLSHSERENERLKLENANLRLQIENIAFDCRVKESSERTKEMQLRLSKETGAKVGRTLASIYYRPPTHLLPSQLYALAVSYFKANEDEKAAVIFTFLTGLEDNNLFKTPRNYLLTGISWYRLANYDLAEAYFDRVLKTGDSAENLQFMAQARLWLGMTAEKQGNHAKSQDWMRELIDYHPHSTEAAWVNSREVRRAPSAEDSEEE